MWPDLERMRNDLRAMREELHALPLYHDVLALERVIRLYERTASNPGSHQNDVATRIEVRRGSDYANSLRDKALEIISGRSDPTPTRVLLQEIEAHGLSVPGDNPANNLSAHLSRDERFLSMGRAGWVEAPTEVGPEFLKELSQQAWEELSQQQQEEAVLSISDKDKAGLPQEVDRILMRVARERLRRHLTDNEKHGLRNQLHFLIEDHSQS